MDNFNPNKCYIEKASNNVEDAQNVQNWTNITYNFQWISSLAYTIIIIYLFFISKDYFKSTVGGDGLRYFLLYFLGLPNLKIFLNTFFAPKLRIDYHNGLLSVNNKNFSIERAQQITIVEICPYHYTWRWGRTPAFNLSGYKKSVITINTAYGDVSFYVCSKKAVKMLCSFFDKFKKDYSNVYDERMLWFTFY